jgi:hypothetical protein
MKFLTILFLAFLVNSTIGQKYVLIDKTMSLPLTQTNTVTIKDEYKNLFAVEKSKLPEFVIALDKIEKQLTKKNIPQSFNFYVGSTRFSGIKIPLKKEERLDVTMTTDCGNNQKTSMHLCDGKISNASNAFFIKTWAGYIRDNMKKIK